jgi:hypothetical protein
MAAGTFRTFEEAQQAVCPAHTSFMPDAEKQRFTISCTSSIDAFISISAGTPAVCVISFLNSSGLPVPGGPNLARLRGHGRLNF